MPGHGEPKLCPSSVKNALTTLWTSGYFPSSGTEQDNTGDTQPGTPGTPPPSWAKLHRMSGCLFVRLLFVRLSIHLSVCPSVRLRVHVSMCPSLCLSAHLYIHRSVCPSVCQFLSSSVSPSVSPLWLLCHFVLHFMSFILSSVVLGVQVSFFFLSNLSCCCCHVDIAASCAYPPPHFNHRLKFRLEAARPHCRTWRRRLQPHCCPECRSLSRGSLEAIADDALIKRQRTYKNDVQTNINMDLVLAPLIETKHCTRSVCRGVGVVVKRKSF